MQGTIKRITYKTKGDAWRPIILDPSSHALPIISYPHSEIHAGTFFYVMYSVISLGAMLTPNDAITLSWTTPNTSKWGHFQFTAGGSADWRLRLIEAPSDGCATPTGALTILNKHRNVSTNSAFVDLSSVANQVSYDATLSTTGTILWDQYLEGAGGPQSGGTVSETRDELILKQNTKYQLSLYGTDANPATLYMSWYEHTDRD